MIDWAFWVMLLFFCGIIAIIVDLFHVWKHIGAIQKKFEEAIDLLKELIELLTIIASNLDKEE